MEDGNKQFVALGAMVFVLGAAVMFGGAEDPGAAARGGRAQPAVAAAWLQQIETGEDHISAAALAGEILAARGDVVLVDLRPAAEFAQFHLPGAVNLTVPDVVGAAGEKLFAAAPRLVVLYSNGPAHPGQAWVELRRQGRDNVKVLDGGLDAFRQEMLTPPSLAKDVDEATAKAAQAAFRLRRAFFLHGGAPNQAATWATDPTALTTPTVVSPAWLQQHLGKVAVVDVRPAPDYAALHVPGAVRLDLKALRTMHGDRELLLRPAAELAKVFSALGLVRSTPVVLVGEDKMQDATLAALALARTGHAALAILEGGVLRWAAERRPLDAAAVTPTPAVYEPLADADDFTIGVDELAQKVQAGATKVLDVRPPEFFSGEKSTEARPGHIPGAVNRPYQRDLVAGDDGQFFRSRSDLEREFAALGLAADAPVTVSCRTGHTASESFFVLRYLLGYRQARWFNGSWTEWAERKDLPAATGGGK